MPKSKKPRKQKRESPAAKIALSKAVESFWVADGGVLPDLVISPIKKVAVYKGLRIADHAVLHAVNNFRWDWQVLHLVFCVDGEGNQYEKAELEVFPSTLRKDIEGQATDTLRKLFLKQNANHIISHGYVASPASTLDLEGMAGDFVEMFEKYGAYDRLVVGEVVKEKYGGEK